MNESESTIDSRNLQDAIDTQVVSTEEEKNPPPLNYQKNSKLFLVILLLILSVSVLLVTWLVFNYPRESSSVSKVEMQPTDASPSPQAATATNYGTAFVWEANIARATIDGKELSPFELREQPTLVTYHPESEALVLVTESILNQDSPHNLYLYKNNELTLVYEGKQVDIGELKVNQGVAFTKFSPKGDVLIYGIGAWEGFSTYAYDTLTGDRIAFTENSFTAGELFWSQSSDCLISFHEMGMFGPNISTLSRDGSSYIVNSIDLDDAAYEAFFSSSGEDQFKVLWKGCQSIVQNQAVSDTNWFNFQSSTLTPITAPDLGEYSASQETKRALLFNQ